MARADAFVYLDTAQFPEAGWVHRNKLLVNGHAQWTTIPVLKSGRGPQRICDVQIRESIAWRRKLVNRIELEYARAQALRVILPGLATALESSYDNLVNINLALLQWLRELLNINTPVFIASSLDSEGHTGQEAQNATRRLVNLVKAVGGTAYLSGPSGRNYMDEKICRREDIELVYNEYQTAAYHQFNTEFVSGLSILDMILWLGPDGAARKIRA